MFFKCISCEEVFSEDELIDVDGDSYEYFGFTGRMSYKGCPNCKCDDLEEVQLCKCKHNYIPDDEDLCDECKQEVANSFREFCKNLSAAEKDFLFDELLEDFDYVKDV